MAVNKIILDDINKIDNLSILSNTKLLEVLNTVIKNEKNLYAQLIEIVDFLNKTYFGESNSDNFITRPVNGKVSSVSITNGKLIVSYYYEGAIHNIIYRLDIESSQQVDPEPIDPDDPTPVPGYDTKPGSKVTILTQFIPEGDISILQPGEVGDYAYADGTIYVWKNDAWTEVTDAYGLYLYDNDIYKYDEGVMTIVLEGADKTPIITTLTRWENYMNNLVLQGNTVGDYAYIVNGVYMWNGTAWVTPTNYDYPLYYIWNNDLYELYESNKIKVVIKGDTKEVYHCIKFGGSAPSQVTNGAYIMASDNHDDDYVGDNCKIYKGENDSWTLLGNPVLNTTYIDCENKIIYYWNGSQFKSIANYSVSEGGISIDIAYTINDPNSTQIPTVKAVTEYVDNKISNISTEDTIGWGEPNFDDPYRPEYYLKIDGDLVRYDTTKQAQIKWGVNFYDWPLRCYNGTVSGITTVSTGAETFEVVGPSERFINYQGGLPEYTTYNVYLNTSTNAFVLKVETVDDDTTTTTYYSKWKNSYEWNALAATPIARRDCVFSDISIEPGSIYKSVRTSKVFGYNGITDFEWRDITSLMTDFSAAVKSCLIANNGNMRLSDRIYFCVYDTTNAETGSLETAFYRKSNFTIDGGKGVLFYRYFRNKANFDTSNANTDIGLIYLSSAHDCTIKNLTLRTLRDRDNNSVGNTNSSTKQFTSSSDSLFSAFRFSIDGTGESMTVPHDILIKNIDLQGFTADFMISPGTFPGSNRPQIRNITIDGWKSREGWHNVLRGTNILIKNANYIQRPYSGPWMHIFYMQETLNHLTVEDSYFAHGNDHSCVSMDAAISCDNEWQVPKDIVFRRCTIEGNRLFQANGNYGYVEQFLIENCVLRQLWSKYVGVNFYEDNDTMIFAKNADWTLKDCTLELKKGSAINQIVAHSGQNIKLINCDVYTDNPDDGTVVKNFISGTLTLENVRTNYKTGIYCCTPNTPPKYAVKTVEQDVTKIQSSLYNSDYTTSVSTFSDLPITASKGDTVNVSSLSQVYVCTKVGIYPQIVCQCAITPDFNFDSTSNPTFTLYLSTNQTISGTITTYNGFTIEDYEAAIAAILTSPSYGYTSANSLSDTRPGTYFFTSGSDSVYLRVTAKGCEDFGYPDGSDSNIPSVSNYTRADYGIGLGKVSYTQGVYTRAGSSNTWEPAGIIASVSDSKLRIYDLEKSNASSTAPDIDEVPEGFFYFDTTDGKPYWKAKNPEDPTTYIWVDATGEPKE